MGFINSQKHLFLHLKYWLGLFQREISRSGARKKKKLGRSSPGEFVEYMGDATGLTLMEGPQRLRVWT